MKTANPVVVLALDAANPDLVRKWAADGTLPAIRGLIDTGLSAGVDGVPGLYVGATWPSFYTGTNPGNHGFSWLDQFDPDQYVCRKVTVDDLTQRPPFWHALAAAGRRVAVLDVPLTAPERIPGGAQIVEWGVHDPLFGFHAYPPDLRSFVLNSAGAHPSPAVCDAPFRTLDQYRAFALQLREGATRRADLTLGVLSSTRWDFLIQVFSETHCVGHQCWHLHDPSHPAYRQADAELAGDPVRSVYQAVDRSIGRILDALAPGTTVCLLILHGMDNMAGATPLLAPLLFRLGVAVPPVPSPGRRDPRAGLARAAGGVWGHLPPGLRQAMAVWRNRVKDSLYGPGWGEHGVMVDTRKSRCFPLPSSNAVGAIRINLAGREARGIVTPGPESERFIAGLTESLLALVDPATGAGLVDRVLRTEQVFSGSHADQLPDLMVEWNLERALGTVAAGRGEGSILRASSPRTGLVEAENTYCRTGEHRLGGFFLVRGPGAARGALARRVSYLDLAPTLAALQGVRVDGSEGRPVPELVEAALA